MAYFERRFRMLARSPSERIVALALTHHRIDYVHPFCDGNDRVSRLTSTGAPTCRWPRWSTSSSGSRTSRPIVSARCHPCSSSRPCNRESSITSAVRSAFPSMGGRARGLERRARGIGDDRLRRMHEADAGAPPSRHIASWGVGATFPSETPRARAICSFESARRTNSVIVRPVGESRSTRGGVGGSVAGREDPAPCVRG